MTSTPLKTNKVVSLPRALMDELREAADAAHRTIPQHIDHCLRIAQSVETAFPSTVVNKLKGAKLKDGDGLLGLIETLTTPGKFAQTEAYKRIIKENPIRIHFDPNDHSVAYLTNDTLGTVTKGRLADNGDFIPESTVSPKD